MAKKTARKKPWNLTDQRFVVFLDIMGFKDMVMRNRHSKIYELLYRLSDQRKNIEDASGLPENYQIDSLKTVSFSDSVVIFTKDSSIECFEVMTAAVSWLFAQALKSDIPMKGAIAFGEISVNITRQIFFGQPIIDAYLLQEDVAFYGIVVHDTAERCLNNSHREMKPNLHALYEDCSVPLKSGKISHYVLNWFIDLETEANKNIPELALAEMKKQRERTSGGPRKYIDNTISVIKEIYTQSR